MQTIALVTYPKYPDLNDDDRLVVPHLVARGIDATAACWDDPAVDWRAFDALVIRSTWNYHHQPDAFRRWMDHREREGSAVYNPLATLRWNMDKQYLLDLERDGIPIPATAVLDCGATVNLAAVLDERGWDRAVVKPRVSATAFETWTVRRVDAQAAQDRFQTSLNKRGLVVQRFMDAVVTDGEWSLLFFGKRWSHGVLKQPKSGDFRVQEEWGGASLPRTPSVDVVQQAQRIVDALPSPLVYLRLDGVVDDGRFVVMEVEALEPYLFLGTDEGAPERFAEAIVEQLGR